MVAALQGRLNVARLLQLAVPPTPSVTKPCPGAPASLTCSAGSITGLVTGCCTCRKTKTFTTMWPSLPGSVYYGFVPDCEYGKSPGVLWPNAEVAYTGAKWLGYNGFKCAKGDYAEIVVQVRVWVLACRHAGMCMRAQLASTAGFA